MKGLFLKDLMLMKVQKRFFLLIFAAAIIIGFTMDNISFAIGYLCFLLPFYSLSTISYDEFDNGNAFLFTLPITRAGYVAEKYLFAAASGVGGAAAASILAFCMGGVPGEVFSTVAGVLAVALVFLAVMLPLQLKFGAEKARIVMLLGAGTVAALAFGAGKLLKLDFAGMAASLEAMNGAALAGIAIAVIAAGMLISIRVSIAIMKKKAF